MLPDAVPTSVLLMATPGDPFDTAELEELRPQQRRCLRLLDDAILQQTLAERQPPPEVEKNDWRRREWALRRLVEQKRQEESLRGHLEQIERNAVHDLVWEVFGNWGAARIEQDQERPAVERGDETFQRLGQLAALLIRADELADDGYTDPRLTVSEPQPK